MTSRIHLFAIPGAFAATGLGLLVTARGFELVMAWIGQLSPNGLSMLRTLCMTVPCVVLPLLAAHLRRRPAARSGDDDVAAGRDA